MGLEIAKKLNESFKASYDILSKVKFFVLAAFISSMIPWADLTLASHPEHATVSCCSETANEIQESCCNDLCSHSCCLFKSYVTNKSHYLFMNLDTSSLLDRRERKPHHPFIDELLDPPRA